MKPYVWSPDHTADEAKNGAYWERNMLAAMCAFLYNEWNKSLGLTETHAGWYKHDGDGYEGWSRVISFNGGAFTFHVPDDFDLGNLPEINPNWNGHTTEKKWNQMMRVLGMNNN